MLRIISGVFLSIFAVLVSYYGYALVSDGASWGIVTFYDLCYLFSGIFLLATGTFLIVGKPMISAITMSIAVIFVIGIYYPQFITYLNDTEPYEDFYTAIPKFFALQPVLSVLTAALFAAVLWLKGKPSLIVAILSAVCGISALVLRFELFGYITGHPTVFNIFPANVIVSVIFAGIYRFSENKTEQTVS